MVAGNALDQKKRFTIPPMAIVAGIVVLVGLGGFWYLDPHIQASASRSGAFDGRRAGICEISEVCRRRRSYAGKPRDGLA